MSRRYFFQVHCLSLIFRARPFKKTDELARVVLRRLRVTFGREIFWHGNANTIRSTSNFGTGVLQIIRQAVFQTRSRSLLLPGLPLQVTSPAHTSSKDLQSILSTGNCDERMHKFLRKNKQKPTNSENAKFTLKQNHLNQNKKPYTKTQLFYTSQLDPEKKPNPKFTIVN